ncbi:MAG: flagellar basal body rod protein FlgC [Candidatus Coatesbacteria bacterium]|nr:flagellar basal body rod protein FlgC [Candidatus Coatesbacteria bacterium]
MSLFDVLDVSSSGLTAQRMRLETISSNIANASTTRTPEGGPYARQDIVFKTADVTSKFGDVFSALTDDGLRGVQVSEILEDTKPPQLRFEPNHPDADADGYVRYPNINIITEMVNMVEATRSYEANLTMMNASKSLALQAIDLGK